MTLKEQKELLIVSLCRKLNIRIHKDAAGVIIPKDGKFLLVQEKMPIPEIFGKWNLPMGRCEKNEEPLQTALREGKEETGYELKIIGDLPFFYYIRIGPIRTSVKVYEAYIVGGWLRIPQDLLDVQWFTRPQIEQLQKEGNLIHPYVLETINRYEETHSLRRRYNFFPTKETPSQQV